MTVAVSAQPVAALRAQLSGNGAEHRRLLSEFKGRDDRIGYSALVHAAFLEAVGRHFTKDSTATDVVRYVADVRSRFDEVANAVNPRVGEQLILEALGKGTTDGVDTRTSATAMQFSSLPSWPTKGWTAPRWMSSSPRRGRQPNSCLTAIPDARALGYASV
jgi:hypothetical protein